MTSVDGLLICLTWTFPQEEKMRYEGRAVRMSGVVLCSEGRTVLLYWKGILLGHGKYCFDEFNGM